MVPAPDRGRAMVNAPRHRFFCCLHGLRLIHHRLDNIDKQRQRQSAHGQFLGGVRFVLTG